MPSVIANIIVQDPPASPYWLAAPLPKVAKLLGVSERTARYLARSGELPTFRVGRSLFVRRTDALNFLDRRFTANRRSEPQRALPGPADRQHAG